MSKIQKAMHYLLHKPSEIIAYIFMKIAFFLPDRIYLGILFRLKMGQRLDLDNPKTFNQKLQWLKLYDRYPEHTNMVPLKSITGLVSRYFSYLRIHSSAASSARSASSASHFAFWASSSTGWLK